MFFLFLFFNFTFVGFVNAAYLPYVLGKLTVHTLVISISRYFFFFSNEAALVLHVEGQVSSFM